MPDNSKQKTDTVKILDKVERRVHTFLKPYGFTKHGRTLHRFVSEDISQVVNFQLGQAYLGATHILCVNIAIRVPECMDYGYNAEQPKKKYYHEYECNIRSRLGTVEHKQETSYNLIFHPIDTVVQDILRQIQNTVLPTFEILKSREAILEKRRDYPEFDQLHGHLILREEAIIHNYLGNKEMASQCYNKYLYELLEKVYTSDANIVVRKGWLSYALELANSLNISISTDNQSNANVFLNQTA